MSVCTYFVPASVICRCARFCLLVHTHAHNVTPSAPALAPAPAFQSICRVCICAFVPLNSTRVCRELAGYKPRCSRQSWPPRDGGANFDGQDGRSRERGGERGGECGWWALINMCPFRSLIPPSLIFYFPPLKFFYFRAKGCPVHAVHITRGSRPSD